MTSAAANLIYELKDRDRKSSLASAINSSVKKHYDRMYNLLLEEVQKPGNSNIKPLLEKIVLASLLTEGEMIFLAADGNQPI